MQKYKNHWLDQREKKKRIKQWERLELLSSNCWLIWKKDVEKYKDKYTTDIHWISGNANPVRDETIPVQLDSHANGRNKRQLETKVNELVFLAYENRDPEIRE
jgi:hypothetical protein